MIQMNEDRKPKYRAIYDEIRGDIDARRYTAGQRLPSDADLAVRFDTSRLTVIRALRDLEQEGVVERKAGSGTFVSAASPTAARTFGILMPDLGDGEVFEPIAQGIARAGEASHHNILWGNLSPTEKDKEEYALELCRYFISRRTAGVFFAPVELSAHQSQVNDTIVKQLDQSGIRILLIDRCLRPFPERSRYDLVGIDNARAGYRMTRHLLDVGCKRLAFAFRPGSAPTVAARLSGFREALWQASIPADSWRTFETDGSNVQLLTRFLHKFRPDGFVCANDLTAAKLMHNLLSLGVRIPEEVRMVGINDVKYARFLPVPLTTLRQPCQEMGFAAMTAMLQRLDKDDTPARDILLDCELIVRQSCGASAVSNNQAAHQQA